MIADKALATFGLAYGLWVRVWSSVAGKQMLSDSLSMA
jgi:hypothetical protein